MQSCVKVIYPSEIGAVYLRGYRDISDGCACKALCKEPVAPFRNRHEARMWHNNFGFFMKSRKEGSLKHIKHTYVEPFGVFFRKSFSCKTIKNTIKANFIYNFFRKPVLFPNKPHKYRILSETYLNFRTVTPYNRLYVETSK